MRVNGLRMCDLLDRAGFRVRGTTRADCIHCEGHSRGTVSFNQELAFCHRCRWTANTLMLARELGLLLGNPEVVSAFREAARRRADIDGQIKKFEAWREARIREVSGRYRSLSKTVLRACEVLAKFPDCEEAWDALARFYHAEAQLSAAFDWLMFTKASAWLETDSSPVEVFETWRRHAA
jgi:hypothetical protein